jgi:hypothetical protein
VSLSGIDLPSLGSGENMLRGFAAQETDCISPNIPARDTGTLL